MNTPVMTKLIQLAELTLDEALQPRCRLDRDLVNHYGQLLRDGDRLPPISVFDDGSALWLADGFHRVWAHRSVRIFAITAEVYAGTRLEAMRFSLSANATHGKPRTRGDLQRAYAIAKQHGLITPGDALAVRRLLKCSSAWAFKLTESDRQQEKIQRNQRILELHAAGQSARAIGRELGLPGSTVGNILRQERVRSWSSNARLFETLHSMAGTDGRRQWIEKACLNRREWLLAEEGLHAQIESLRKQLADLLAIRWLVDRLWTEYPNLSLEAVSRQMLDADESRFGSPPKSSHPAWLQGGLR